MPRCKRQSRCRRTRAPITATFGRVSATSRSRRTKKKASPSPRLCVAFTKPAAFITSPQRSPQRNIGTIRALRWYGKPTYRPAAVTVPTTGAQDFVTTDGGPFQEFLEFVRPLTIIGRLPGTTPVEFLKPVGVQTGGGEGYWVGEGIAKPLTSFAATPTRLPPTKVANIVAVTEEWLKYASANNDQRIRDSMAGALQERLDTDFVDPAKRSRPASLRRPSRTARQLRPQRVRAITRTSSLTSST